MAEVTLKRLRGECHESRVRLKVLSCEGAGGVMLV